jgi:hypothetical protein
MSKQTINFVQDKLKQTLQLDILDGSIEEKEHYIKNVIGVDYDDAKNGNLKSKRAFHSSITLVSRMLFNIDVKMPKNMESLDAVQFHLYISQQLSTAEYDIYEIYLYINNMKYHICNNMNPSMFDNNRTFAGLENYISSSYEDYCTRASFIEKKYLLGALLVSFISKPSQAVEVLSIICGDLKFSYDCLLTKLILEYNSYMKDYS